MNEVLDCTALACPGPVMRVKKAVENTDATTLEVIVGNFPAKENVLRFLASQNKEVLEVLEDGATFRIIAQLGTPAREEQKSSSTLDQKDAVGPTYIINSDSMGRGDEELGKMLYQGFLSTLPELEQLPEALFFLNSGIYYCLEDSPVLGALKDLESRGVEIFTCGTCTGHLGVTDKLAVGVLGSIFDLTELHKRDRVVTL